MTKLARNNVRNAMLLLMVIVAGSGCGASSVAARPAANVSTRPEPNEIDPSESIQGSCSQGSPRAALGSLATTPSASLLARGTGVESYKLAGGAWLTQAPVLVNEDFDFAKAIALGAVGAGLSAAERRKNNEARAAELNHVTLSDTAAHELDALRACGIHRWALLWKGREPALLIVSDYFDESGNLVQTLVETRAVDENLDGEMFTRAAPTQQ